MSACIAIHEHTDIGEARRVAAEDLPARFTRLSKRLRRAYDTRPVSRDEWNAASGDDL